MPPDARPGPPACSADFLHRAAVGGGPYMFHRFPGAPVGAGALTRPFGELLCGARRPRRAVSQGFALGGVSPPRLCGHPVIRAHTQVRPYGYSPAAAALYRANLGGGPYMFYWPPEMPVEAGALTRPHVRNMPPPRGRTPQTEPRPCRMTSAKAPF